MKKMISHPIHAFTLTGALISIIIIAVLILSFSQIKSEQHHRQLSQYQRLQAMNIAHNQLARQLAKLPCEPSVKHNDIRFIISCDKRSISVSYPLGNYVLQ